MECLSICLDRGSRTSARFSEGGSTSKDQETCSRVCPHLLPGAPISEPAFYRSSFSPGARPAEAVRRCWFADLTVNRADPDIHHHPLLPCIHSMSQYFLSSHNMSPPHPPDTGCGGWGRNSTHFPSLGRAWSLREVHSLALGARMKRSLPTAASQCLPLGSLSTSQAPACPESPEVPTLQSFPILALIDVTSPSYQQWPSPEGRGRTFFITLPKTGLEHRPPKQGGFRIRDRVR